MTLSWQGSLFDGAAPVEPLSFDRVTRHRLDERSWLDEVPGWLPDHGTVFDLLLAEAPWRQRERRMYDRTVLEPRMVAGWSGDSLADLPAPLEEMREVVSGRYRVDFDKIANKLPGFSCDWDAVKGAQQLYSVFSTIDLDQETFTGRGHTRLLQLQQLMRTGQVDGDLFWKQP